MSNDIENKQTKYNSINDNSYSMKYISFIDEISDYSPLIDSTNFNFEKCLQTFPEHSLNNLYTFLSFFQYQDLTDKLYSHLIQEKKFSQLLFIQLAHSQIDSSTLISQYSNYFADATFVYFYSKYVDSESDQLIIDSIFTSITGIASVKEVRPFYDATELNCANSTDFLPQIIYGLDIEYFLKDISYYLADRDQQRVFSSILQKDYCPFFTESDKKWKNIQTSLGQIFIEKKGALQLQLNNSYLYHKAELMQFLIEQGKKLSNNLQLFEEYSYFENQANVDINSPFNRFISIDNQLKEFSSHFNTIFKILYQHLELLDANINFTTLISNNINDDFIYSILENTPNSLSVSRIFISKVNNFLYKDIASRCLLAIPIYTNDDGMIESDEEVKWYSLFEEVINKTNSQIKEYNYQNKSKIELIDYLKTALFESCKYGLWYLFFQIVSLSYFNNVHYFTIKDEDGNTLLHSALNNLSITKEDEKERKKGINIIINKIINDLTNDKTTKTKLSTFPTNNKKETILHLAAKQDNLSIFDAFSSILITSLTNEKRTILMYACIYKSPNVGNEILKRFTKPGINFIDNYYNTPLMHLCKNSSELASNDFSSFFNSLLDIVLQNDKNIINFQNMEGDTALHLFLSNLKDIVIQNDKNLSKLIEYCQKLITKENINLKNKNGLAPLHIAIKNSENTKIEIIECLLSKGADPNIADDDGKTPLEIALSQHPLSINICTILILFQSNPSALYQREEITKEKQVLTQEETHKIEILNQLTDFLCGKSNNIYLAIKNQDIDLISKFTKFISSNYEGNKKLISYIAQYYNEQEKYSLLTYALKYEKNHYSIAPLLFNSDSCMKMVNGKNSLYYACKYYDKCHDILIEIVQKPKSQEIPISDNFKLAHGIWMFFNKDNKRDFNKIKKDYFSQSVMLSCTEKYPIEPFYAACMKGNERIIKYYFEELNKNNDDDLCSPPSIKKLLGYVKKKQGKTPFYWACNSLNYKLFDYLANSSLSPILEKNAIFGIYESKKLYKSNNKQKTFDFLYYFLQNYKNLDVTDSNGNTLLMIIVKNNMKEDYEHIIGKTTISKPNLQNADGDTLLILAARNGYYNLTKKILELSHIDIDISNKQGDTALHAAISNWPTSLISDKEINTNISYQNAELKTTSNNDTINDQSKEEDPSSTSENSLNKNGYSSIVKALIEHNVYIDAVNNKGETPLIKAVKNNNLEAVKLLVEYGYDKAKQSIKRLDIEYPTADVNYSDSMYRTPLFHAALLLDTRIYDYLIECSQQSKSIFNHISDLSQDDIEDNNVIHVLAKKKSSSLPFREYKNNQYPIFDLNILYSVNVDGKIPFFLACESGNKELVFEILHFSKECLFFNDGKGISPLAAACINHHTIIVSIILLYTLTFSEKDRERILESCDKMGNSILHIACMHNNNINNNNQKIVEILIDPSSIDENIINQFINRENYAQKEQIKTQLKELSIDVNNFNDLNCTPIIYACKNGSRQIMNILLEKGAKIAPNQIIARIMLLSAIQFGFIDLVKELDKTGIFFGSDQSNNESKIYSKLSRDKRSSSQSHFSLVNHSKKLDKIKSSYNFKVPELGGTNSNPSHDKRKHSKLSSYLYDADSSPLYYACKFGQYDIVKYLLKKADVKLDLLSSLKSEDPDDIPYNTAFNRGHMDIFNYILSFLNEKDLRALPFEKACLNGKKKSVEQFLELNSRSNNINKMNSEEKKNALISACKSGNFDIVKLLLDYKDNEYKLNIESLKDLQCKENEKKDNTFFYSWTPYISQFQANYSITNEQLNSILKENEENSSITKSEFNIIVQDNDGYTPLHYAAQGGYFNIVNLLILELEKVDNFIEILLGKKQDFLSTNEFINMLSNDKKSALSIAYETNHDDIASFLISKGAKKQSILIPLIKKGKNDDIINLYGNSFDKIEKDENDEKFRGAITALLSNNTQILQKILSSNSLDPFKINKINEYNETSIFHIICLTGNQKYFDKYAKKDSPFYKNNNIKFDVSNFNKEANGWRPVQIAIFTDNPYFYSTLKHRPIRSDIDCIYENKLITFRKLYKTNKNFAEILKTVSLQEDLQNLLDGKNQTTVQIITYLIEKGRSLDMLSYILDNLKNYLPIGPLCSAVEKNNISAALIIIPKVDMLSKTSDDKNTPLILALQLGYREIANIIIDYCNEYALDMSINNGLTAIHVACEKGYDDIVEKLINNGANITALDYQNRTPLFIAALNHQLKICELLVSLRSNLLERDHNGNIPLHAVCLSAKQTDKETLRSIITLLIRHGSDINDTNNNNETPLIIATIQGHKENVEILLDIGENGFDANSVNGENNTNIVHNIKLDVNKRNSDSNTALEESILHRKEEIALTLLKDSKEYSSIIDISSPNPITKMTPIQQALKKQMSKTSDRIFDLGQKRFINVLGKYDTILSYTIIENNYTLFEEMINNIANDHEKFKKEIIKYSNIKYQTILHIAVINNGQNYVDLIIEKIIKYYSEHKNDISYTEMIKFITQQDFDEKTVFHYACIQQNNKIILALFRFYFFILISHILQNKEFTVDGLKKFINTEFDENKKSENNTKNIKSILNLIIDIKETNHFNQIPNLIVDLNNSINGISLVDVFPLYDNFYQIFKKFEPNEEDLNKSFVKIFDIKDFKDQTITDYYNFRIQNIEEEEENMQDLSTTRFESSIRRPTRNRSNSISRRGTNVSRSQNTNVFQSQRTKDSPSRRVKSVFLI